MHWAAWGGDIARETLVVFHIACWQIFRGFVLKFRKQILWHFSKHIHEDIQSTAMSHSNHNFLHASSTRTPN